LKEKNGLPGKSGGPFLSFLCEKTTENAQTIDFVSFPARITGFSRNRMEKLEFVGLDALQIPVVSCQWSVVRMTQRRANPFAGHWPLVTGHLLSDKLKFKKSAGNPCGFL
jgi:hypothetical protein